MPHVRHVCVLLPLVRPHIRHAHLGLYIVVSLKGIEQLAFGLLVVVSLVLLQWDVLASDYYLVQLLFYNYRLFLKKDQEIKVFHIGTNPSHHKCQHFSHRGSHS